MTEGDRGSVGVGQRSRGGTKLFLVRPLEELRGGVTEFPGGQQGRAAPTDSKRGGGRQDSGHYRAAHCCSRK